MLKLKIRWGIKLERQSKMELSIELQVWVIKTEHNLKQNKTRNSKDRSKSQQDTEQKAI
jgi:hypothetical protein